MSLGTWDTGGDDGQTALLLTQQEWDDLAFMVSHYRRQTDWAGDRPNETRPQVADICRRRGLAERIIEANQ